jgi:hypothetical protein
LGQVFKRAREEGYLLTMHCDVDQQNSVSLSQRKGPIFMEGAFLLVVLLLLASCANPTGTVATSPGIDTDRAAATPTPAAYWDLLPLTSQPEGGWKTYRSEELGLAFQYPAVYDELDCGQILRFEKDYEDAACSVVGFGSIRIHVWEAWEGNVGEHAASIQTKPEVQLLTAVEPFSIDGVPAFRVVHTQPRQADLEYVKSAFAAFGGKLHEFSYGRMLLSTMQCDAPPLSQEAVYEHLLSTFEFID